MSIKWEMKSSDKFIGISGEYTLVVYPNGSVYSYWEIIKDGVIVDNARKHHPVTTLFNKELACKAQAEKYLNLLTNPPQGTK